MAHQDNVKWIIPPSLASTVKKYNKHCTIALERRMPVLVHGATGVGKSLFLKLYVQAYEKKFSTSEDSELWINCSHFS